MKDKKLVLPGFHIASALEAMGGKNTYTENDEIYSSSLGTLGENEREVEVEARDERQINIPKVGDDVYCTVDRVSDNKAFVSCILANDLEKSGSSKDIPAVIPVNKIRSEHVRSVKEEVGIGDIVKGKIVKLENSMVDISIYGPEYGVVRAFCFSCRKPMVLKEGSLICTDCEKQTRRKISNEYPSEV
jgi:exosome complex component CSL4